MQAFDMTEVLSARAQADVAYLEFLRVPAISLGVYVLPAGGVDPQKPHTEAEVYYVASGRAQVTVGDEARAVEPGSLIFVSIQQEHRFHDIVEDLTLLVFFAPAEYSAAPATPVDAGGG